MIIAPVEPLSNINIGPLKDMIMYLSTIKKGGAASLHSRSTEADLVSKLKKPLKLVLKSSKSQIR